MGLIKRVSNEFHTVPHEHLKEIHEWCHEKIRIVFQRRLLITAFVGVVVAGSVNCLVYFLTELSGIYALGGLAEQLQEAYTGQVAGYMEGKMEPLRIYLEQGVALFDALNYNLSRWEGNLELTLEYQRSFLEHYFDESRCCSAIFTNIYYAQDVKGCHAIAAPGCHTTNTGSLEGELAEAHLGGNGLWAGVIHYSDTYTTGGYPGLESNTSFRNARSGDFAQVLPGDCNGRPNNTLSFRWYEGKRSMSAWRGDKDLRCTSPAAANCKREEDSNGNLAAKMGFVHWPIVDGYWYRDIHVYNMSKMETRFAERVFPWTLYPPAVLKTHMFTPVFDPNGRQIGGWVVGFKLHWIGKYLANLDVKAGSFIFVVERKTGVLIASSDTSIKVLKNYGVTASVSDLYLALDHPDERIALRAKTAIDLAENSNSWTDVPDGMSRPTINFKEDGSDEFLITKGFNYKSLEWVIVLTIPSDSIMSDIEDNRLQRVMICLGIALAGKCLIAGCSLIAHRCFPVPSPMDRARQAKSASENGSIASCCGCCFFVKSTVLDLFGWKVPMPEEIGEPIPDEIGEDAEVVYEEADFVEVDDGGAQHDAGETNQGGAKADLAEVMGTAPRLIQL